MFSRRKVCNYCAIGSLNIVFIDRSKHVEMSIVLLSNILGSDKGECIMKMQEFYANNVSDGLNCLTNKCAWAFNEHY